MQLVNPPSDPFDVFITRDPAMARIVQQLRQWAQIAADGLITGEPGVGKSLVARLLHMASSPSRAPLVVRHADEPTEVAHPWATLESRGGTLVCDALERWSLDDQATIVQQLDTWGRVQVQVLGLSRMSLSRLELEGRLHPALARRWASQTVHLPPLRTRPDDLAPLVQVMLRRSGRPSARLEPDAWRALAAYGWPDNVRELRRVVDATLARAADEPVGARELALDPLAPPALEVAAELPYDAMRREVDAWYLRRLIHHTDGNLSEASRRAGCSRKVLRDRLRRHGLYTPPLRDRPGARPSAPAESVARALRLVDPEAGPGGTLVAQEARPGVWLRRGRGRGPAAA